MSRIFLSSPDVGLLEREALLRAFDSGWVAPAGPELDAFESDVAAITGWPGAVAMSSGTGALHLALLEQGVQPGNDVLVSSFTFAATANAVASCGATPIFIDSDTATWNMSPQLLAEELAAAKRRNRLPAAVVVVDLYGQCADYDEIVPACHELGIPVVEDAAEALGATYKGRPAGALAGSSSSSSSSSAADEALMTRPCGSSIWIETWRRLRSPFIRCASPASGSGVCLRLATAVSMNSRVNRTALSLSAFTRGPAARRIQPMLIASAKAMRPPKSALSRARNDIPRHMKSLAWSQCALTSRALKTTLRVCVSIRQPEQRRCV